jgi:predicted O-linked N-acetylglucosamine transferase (SPINDLY family)
VSTTASPSSIASALRAGDWDEAIERARGLLRDVPDCGAAHHGLGLALAATGDVAGAQQALERAAALDDSPAIVQDLAAVYARRGRVLDVVRVLSPRADMLDPPALAVFAGACVDAGDPHRAIAAADRPGVADGHAPTAFEVARALLALGRTAEAVARLERCVAADPAMARAHDLLALVHHDAGRGDAALRHWEAAAALRPASGAARLRVALALATRGRLAEARAARLEAEALGLAHADRSVAIRLRLFDPEEDARSIRDASRASFEGVRVRPHTPVRRSNGRLRVGYIAGEFNRTPAYYFVTPFLAAHDRSEVEVVLYHASHVHDARTEDYRRLADRWRDIADVEDDALRRLVADDRIDVLVDLSGHIQQNRLWAMASRAAPVQAAFPNYPSTTGCPAIDYLVTDRWTSPAGTEGEYTERLHRVASGCLVYAPPAAPAPGPPPAGSAGRVTFGVLQQLIKLTDACCDAFAAILHRTPGSRLLLHNGDAELDNPVSRTVLDLRARLSARGVDPDRLHLVGPLEHGAHLALLTTLDIALDTWPYTGQTTTMECLWMGVPVVAMRARGHVGRVSAALLQRAGLDALVASTPGGYVERACALAGDVDALVAYRASLRERCVSSGLTDGPALARALESAYREWTGAAR